jgi:hypothetical protein
MNEQLQAGDEQRCFYMIQLTQDEAESQELEPFQYFPKKLITAITLKNSNLGRNIYLMECVSSPLFIHRKNDVIKMSIDFKGSEIVSVKYQHFFERDLIGVIINTVEENHMSLVNLRTLRILNHVVTERDSESSRKLKFVSCFLGGANQSLLMGVNDRGLIYYGDNVVFDPGFSKQKLNLRGRHGLHGHQRPAERLRGARGPEEERRTETPENAERRPAQGEELLAARPGKDHQPQRGSLLSPHHGRRLRY